MALIVDMLRLRQAAGGDFFNPDQDANQVASEDPSLSGDASSENLLSTSDRSHAGRP